MNKICMPKACVSCIHFNPIGRDFDSTHQVTNEFSSAVAYGARIPFGICSMYGVECFSTQICNRYSAEELIEVVDVTNRSEPREPIQESIF